MAFLDSVTITLDVILTERGRRIIASGGDHKITQFALADDGIDYQLWNPDHASGSYYYGAGIENKALLEPLSNGNHMRYKLVSLPRDSTRVPSGRLIIEDAAFKRFEDDEDVGERFTTVVTKGVWSMDDIRLNTNEFYRTAARRDATDGYMDVYRRDPDTYDYEEPQFSVSYGHYSSSAYNVATPSIYRQFQTMLNNLPVALQTGAERPTKFQFYARTGSSDDCVFVSLKRSRYKDGLQAGTWELQLSSSLVLIDDSSSPSGSTSTHVGSRYNIVSGTVAAGISGSGAAGITYGHVYPDLGIFVFDWAYLRSYLTDAAGGNDPVSKFFTGLVDGGNFTAYTKYELKSTHYFVRALNRDFNFSTNPTWTLPSVDDGYIGKLRYNDMHGDPKVYITTIGLYNDTKDLIAIGRFSRPVIKTFSNEVVARVRVDV